MKRGPEGAKNSPNQPKKLIKLDPLFDYGDGNLRNVHTIFP